MPALTPPARIRRPDRAWPSRRLRPRGPHFDAHPRASSLGHRWIDEGHQLTTRVLVLVDQVSDRIGGAERFAAAVAAALPPDRFEVWLCATRALGDGVARLLEDAGVNVFTLGRRGRFDVLPFVRLARILRDEQIDVLHAHMFGSNVWGTLVGRLSGVPVVIAHEHTWSYRGKPLRRFLDGFVIGRLATRFIAVSEADRKKMIEIEHVPAERVVAVPTAYIPRVTATGDLRAELSLPEDAPVVGTIAVLRPQKALDVLIEAFGQVHSAVPAARLVLVGDGPSREQLEQRVEAAGLSESVHFTGTRGDIETVLGAFDIAAMSSDFEGMPLFVLECMAHRVPLVATGVGGVPEIVTDGETGLLVPPRDPHALAAAIQRLLEDPDERERLSSAALEHLGEFTLERAAERFAALYETLLAERRD